MRFLAASILCCSCTVSEEYQDGRLVSRALGIGIVREAPCLNRGERRETETLGLTVSGSEAVIGYRASDRICLPVDSCAAIFFVDSDAQIAAIHRLFPDLASACVITKNPVRSSEKRSEP